MEGQSTRREQTLNAAVTVLAKQGLRALTHRRVDATAGVPLGTTSNYFPTWHKLAVATIEHIAEWVTNVGAHGADDEALDPKDALVTVFCRQINRGLTDWKTPILAWNRMVFELPEEPGIKDVIIEVRNGGIKVYSALLQRCGSPDPERHAWLVMSYVKGIHLRQYVLPDPDLDAEALIRPLLDTLLQEAPKHG